MRLPSVNVGDATPLEGARKSGKTGIYKRPLRGPVEVLFGCLKADKISDKENHGGPDQAAYVFGSPDYEWWSEALGRDLSPGTFGENLTVCGLESAAVCVGDRLGIGSAVLEVTAPRTPCLTLAVRMGDPVFSSGSGGRSGQACTAGSPGKARSGRVIPWRTRRTPGSGCRCWRCSGLSSMGTREKK